MLSLSQTIAIAPLLVLFSAFPSPGISQTTFAVPFTYQIGGVQPEPVLYDIFSPTPISVSVTTDGATWVTPSLSGNTTPAVLTIAVNTTGLQAGKYSSTIHVVSSQGPLTFNVTLDVTAGSGSALTLSASSFTFSAVAGGSAPATQTLTVTATTSVSATAQVSLQSCASSNWLSLSPTGSFTASPANTVFTISINQSGIAAGTTCSATISVTAASVTKTATVTLNVTETQILTLSPSSFTFSAVAGGSALAPQALTVTAPASVDATAQVSQHSCTGSNWLILSPAGSFTTGTANTVFTVSVNQLGIAAGTTCSGTISITAASVTKTATVTLSVTALPPSEFTLNPSAYTFSAVAGAAAPTSQTLIVTAGTFMNATAEGSVQSCLNTNWLTLSPTGSFTAGPSGTIFTFSVNQTGYFGGTSCKGTISIVTPSATHTVPVVMNVIHAPAVILTLSPSVLSFNAVAGGLAVASQTLKVSATFETSATVQASQQSCGNISWLTASPTGSVTLSPSETNFTISVIHAGIAAGATCEGAISIVAGSAARTVHVTLNVAAAANPQLTFNLSAVTFDAVAGGTAPVPQTLTVTAPANTSATARTSVDNCSSDWLTLSPTGSFTAGPATTYFTVSVNQSVFAAGTICTGAIIMVSTSGTQTLPVSMAVKGPPALPVVSAAPTTLSFSHAAGDPNPAPAMIAVSGAGAAATFSVSTSNPEWLKVLPACTLQAPCTTPNTGAFTLSVTADPAGLNAGKTYYGVVVISGLGQTQGTTNVNASLTVTAPLPAITLVTNTASFVTGPVSPGEMISIFADPSSPIGPATAVVLSGTTCPHPCTTVPTTMGGVQVMFQPLGVAAPLTYVSDTQINCLVPYEIVGRASIKVEVSYLGQKSSPVMLQSAPTQPGVFTASGTGTGLASVQQYDDQGNYRGQNSSGTPGKAGWHITFYVTGEGIIPAPAVTGRITGGANVVPLLGPPKVLIDDQPSVVTHFAEAEGFVSGLMQVNAIIPAGVRTGQAVPLKLSMDGNHSQSGVVIYIK